MADTAPSSPLRSSRVRMAAALGVSLVVLLVLALKIDVRVGHLLEEWSRADKGLLAVTFVYSALWHLFVGADKWYRILRGLGADVGYWEVFRVRLGSDPVRFASPFKSGEIFPAIYIYKKGRLTFGRSASSILFDKVLNYAGTWFWLVVGFSILGVLPKLGELVFLAVTVGALLAVFTSERVRGLLGNVAGALHPKLRRFAEGTLSAFREFSWRRKLGFLLYGIVFQLRPLIVCWLLFAAFGAYPSLREILTYGSIVVLMSNVPLTTGGIGPREAALALLFSRYGSPEMLFSVGILMSISILVVPAILGLPLMPALLRTAVDTVANGTAAQPDAGESAPARAEAV